MQKLELKGWLSLTGGFKDAAKAVKYEELIMDDKWE